MPRPPSQLIQSACGPMEYALRGTGPIVLLSHGTGGGYDQGLMLARLLDGFQGLAVSRAGYLRTPLPSGPTPAALADAYAALLDVLQIEQAAIFGLSAGGMSAAFFALHHPDRCRALVLADAITQPPPATSARVVARLNALPDGVAWLLTRLAVYLALPLMTRDTETRSLLRVFFENHPISERRAGVESDLANVHAMQAFPWEQVRVPTLLVHGDRDPLIPLEFSREVARRVPGAELFVVPGGGHECPASHHRLVRPVLNGFLQKPA